MSRFLGSVAGSSVPENDVDIGPVQGLYVKGKQHETVSLLAQYDQEIIRVSEWKHMIRPKKEVPKAYNGIVTTLAVIPSVASKALAAVAYVSGQAVGSFYKTVAWHHYIVVECTHATFKIELCRDGVQVQGIVGEVDGQAHDAVRERRRRQFTGKLPDQEHPDAGTEISSIDFEGFGTTLEPLRQWLAENLQEKYHLLEWNCQHFCDVVMALFQSCHTYR